MVMQYILGAAAVVLAVLAETTADGKGIELDSREYKMMLHEEHFGGSTARQAVDGFVLNQLVPAVRGSFGGEAANELRRKGLDLKERRLVRFWDTDTCGLGGHGFALRERADLDALERPAKERELTLKFRSPDLFLAADMRLEDHEGDDGRDSKFEEDVGALAVRNWAGKTIVAVPPSSKSQFSRSFTRAIGANAVPRALDEVEQLYPGFANELRQVAGPVDMTATLEPGLDYRELVYASSKLQLAADTKAEFALTIWYRSADEQNAPALAEISFSYATDDGAVGTEAARRARDLLLAMQGMPWADPAAPTKTALVACVD
jgi:hypothetical protein